MELLNETLSQTLNFTDNECIVKSNYLEFEAYCYLLIMCPLALIGIILNIISLRVFNDKSFNSVTFKYLRLIALTDLFICITVIPYCLTAYTQPWNKYDLFARHFYLVYVYIPGANLAINLSMFLNLLVTIERLISVGWPVQKHKLFKPSRYYMSCVIVMILALVFNLVNFFLYKIEFCKSDLIPRSFTMHRWWSIYGYARELLTRVMPIILLVIANIILIGIVRSSRNRMKKNRGNNSAAMTKQQSVNNQENIEFIDKNGGNKDQKATIIDIQSSSTGANKKPAVSRNRQENQLTTMTIFVAIMYVISSIPMVFAYPGLLFSAEQTTTKTYKFYAALVNILELLQCSFRFLIYFCFTTQFRLKFYELHFPCVKRSNN